jgi:hypothetical protein
MNENANPEKDIPHFARNLQLLDIDHYFFINQDEKQVND